MITEWDWEYLSMNDEEFAYVTRLTKEKIEQAKQKESKVEYKEE